jgi:two-component system response regulator (stage 0 sporulation protein F)
VTDQPKPKILVVDDAGPVVILCVNVLQALGYSIRAANRGDIALELLRKDAFDLLVVDYKMPGMNGFQVLEEARRLRPNIACMLMTAHGTPDIINEATRLGFNYILLKPFTPSELRGAVDKVLGRAR